MLGFGCWILGFGCLVWVLGHGSWELLANNTGFVSALVLAWADPKTPRSPRLSTQSPLTTSSPKPYTKVQIQAQD